MSANIVLYALHGSGAQLRRVPLLSCAPDDVTAALQISAAAANAMRDAANSGVPNPKLQTLHEEREEIDGRTSASRYTELHPVSLESIGKTEATREAFDPK